MTAAATILAILLIAAVIYILVQAELHHEDAGTIRDLKARVIVQQLDLNLTRTARDDALIAARLFRAMALDLPTTEAAWSDESAPIHDETAVDIFRSELDAPSETWGL